MSAKWLHGNPCAVAVKMLVCATLGMVYSLSALATNEARGRALYENQM